ncbi:VCBS repeat-containing protein [Micromonospora sp. NPDC049559]|uniref:FG-GAP repeat domain-containing protein n=1 Tax=Micromonospora sp. NPDC049559 TaxID=3155923 RepID=UPI0034471540
MWRRRIATLAATAALAPAGAVAPAPAWAGGQGDPMYGYFNADRLTDRAALTVGPAGECVVVVHLGRVGGGYLPASSYVYLRPAEPGTCPDLGVAVDLGTDGTTELVVGWFSGRPAGVGHDLLVLRAFRVATGFAAIFQPSYIGLADFNGDGRQDVYEWTDQGEGFRTYLNTGTGGLTPGPVRWCSGRPEFRLVDLNRNGAMDVVISYLEGCGAYFSGVVAVLDNGTAVDLEGDPDGLAYWGVEVADVNGDTIPDVVATNRVDGRLDHFIGCGDGTFVRATRAVQDKPTVSATRRTNIPVMANDYATTAARLAIVTPPLYGTVSVTSSRSVVYTPNARSAARTDRFVYRLTEYGRTSSAAVTLRVSG